MENTKQTAKQRYYEKNKELYKERVRQQRETAKAKQQNTTIIKEIENDSIQNNTNIKKVFVRMPFPALDFLIWAKRMTYVTIDIRDTTGEFVWNGINKQIKENNDIVQNKYKTEPTSSIKSYIDSIKRFLRIGERYVIEVPSEKLNIPVFFYIKTINEENILISYVKIEFIKWGTGEASIEPKWNEVKKETIIENKNVIDIYPYDEKKKYKYESYCYIRNDVRTFYEIVNKR